MRFLIDQDVYQTTVEFIKSLGHKAIRVKDVGLASADDETIIAYALSNKLALVTRDNDYGALVFLKNKKHHGVVFLKIEPRYVDLVHKELNQVFKEHSEQELKISFIVVEPGRHRIRKLNSEIGN
jgi:predicted nuclease of predicted toxin-antitoxin system